MPLKKFLPVARYHLMWSIVYLVLIGGSIAYAGHLYRQHDEDRLPAGFISLSLNKEQYTVGETVEFTVTNHFPTSIFIVNHCPQEPLIVYHWKDGAWKELHAIARENGKCYGEERKVAIPPEGSRGYDFADWPTLFTEPGVYRIAMAVENYSEIPFKDFVVVPVPVPVATTTPVEVTEEPAPTTPVPATVPIPVPVPPEPEVIVTPVEDATETVEDTIEPDDDRWEREYERDDD